MTKIYISGCGGMLGDAFYKLFKATHELKCTDIDLNEDYLSYCDIRNFQSYRRDVGMFNPDYLFHLGAYTDLEFCEHNRDEAYRTNTMAVENAVYIANELDIPLVYISTGIVFDGQKDEYDDYDTPNPLNVYARTKYLGERFVIENAKRYLVCRAGWMIGGKDKKFVSKILDQINNGAKEINAVINRRGTLTYTHDFALNVRLLLEAELWGVYNIACAGDVSFYSLAKEIVSILGVDVKVNEVDHIKEYYVQRPKFEVLINKKLNLRGLNIMQDWRTSLKKCLK
jgi:dTDP-4-dehydrorhamnose reductase